ncbi:MAG: hypothetical protein SNJ75_15990, partial [Gemmataceae bacterium]
MAFTTRSSLLARVRSDGADIWQDFCRVYTPFLARVAERLWLRGQDVDEVVQAVLVDLFQRREAFIYDRSRGRFRDYLKKAVISRLSKLLREIRQAGTPTEAMPEPWADELEQHWEQQYRQHLLREALALVREQVDP